MENIKLLCFVIVFTLFENVVKTQSPKNGGASRDFLHPHSQHDFHHNMHFDATKLIIDGGGDASNLAFHPEQLNFLENPVGDPKNYQVTLFNHHKNQSVILGLISGRTPDFYSSYFEDKVIPPGGNTTFSVVFLPRQQGLIDGVLIIDTSFGTVKYELEGKGTECPYRLTPLVGLRVPFNATLSPEISMYNPHSTPLQIIEVFSSGGNFHLELPSGGHEGAQVLWEIPPFCTKPIIKIKFTANIPGNHTAYVRIKISGNDPDVSERVLVVPIEVEILQDPGIYSSISFLDFGILGSNDEPPLKQLRLYNTGTEKFEIRNLSIIGVSDEWMGIFQNTDDADVIDIFSNWSKLKQSKVFSGLVVINTSLNYFTIPFLVNVVKGSVDFSDREMKFITSNKIDREHKFDLTIRNNYEFAMAITNLSISSDFFEHFVLHNNLLATFSPMAPLIIPSGESVKLFRVTEKNSSAMNVVSSYISIVSNITINDIHVVRTSGLLRRIVPIEEEGGFGIDEKALNFGTLSISKSSDTLMALVNENPVPIKIMNWKSSISGQASITVILRGCGKLNMKKLMYCTEIEPGDWIVYQISVQSHNVGSFQGKLVINTQYEEVVTPVKFTIAMGRLELDSVLLNFRDCFPVSLNNIIQIFFLNST